MSLVSSFKNASCAKFGIENGLCEKSIFLSSSFHSYIGKSTTQQKWNVVRRLRPSSLPMRVRAAPASFAAASALPAEKNSASPPFTPAP